MFGYDTFALPDVVLSVFTYLAFGQLRFAGGEAIPATGVGDHLQIIVDQAAADCFLVANELFFLGSTQPSTPNQWKFVQRTQSSAVSLFPLAQRRSSSSTRRSYRSETQY
jgi:hypothetical protein